MTEVVPQLASFPKERADEFRAVYQNFGADDAKKVKAFEKITRHVCSVDLPPPTPTAL